MLKPGLRPSLRNQSSSATLAPAAADRGPKVHIFYASTGTTATKLAERLRKKVSQSGRAGQYDTLNAIEFKSLAREDTILMVVATTGNGDFPSNGVVFEETFDALRKKYAKKKLGLNYAIFGVGDSGYSTFNSAAIKLDQLFQDIGGSAVAPLVKSDVMMEALPLASLNGWWAVVEASLQGGGAMPVLPTVGPEQAYVNHSVVVRAFSQALLDSKISSTSESEEDHILKVELDLARGQAEVDYTPMCHLRLLPRNSVVKVERMLEALGRQGLGRTFFHFGGSQSMYLEDFLRDVVDLEGAFTSLKWLPSVTSSLDLIDRTAPVLEVVEKLSELRKVDDQLLHDLCLDIPLLRPRTFSVASARGFFPDRSKDTVELLVRVHPKGRVSDIYLSEINPLEVMKYSFIEKVPGIDLLTLTDRPIITITTGTGFAPIRSLIQHRIILSRAALADGKPRPFTQSPISLFVGFKPIDWDLITDTLDEGVELQLFDSVGLVQSNPEKKRVQDYVAEHGFTPDQIDRSYVYVCGTSAMVKQVYATLSDILKVDLKTQLGARYIEEIF